MPTSTQPGDPLLRAQQRLGRDPAEQHQVARLRQRDVAQEEGQEERDLGIGRGAVPRRAEGQDVGDVEILGAARPMQASMRSSNWPETPTKGGRAGPRRRPAPRRSASGRLRHAIGEDQVGGGLAQRASRRTRPGRRAAPARVCGAGAASGGAGGAGRRAARRCGRGGPAPPRGLRPGGCRARPRAGRGAGAPSAATVRSIGAPPAPRPRPSRSAAGAPRSSALLRHAPPAVPPCSVCHLLSPGPGFRASGRAATSARPGGARHVRR